MAISLSPPDRAPQPLKMIFRETTCAVCRGVAAILLSVAGAGGAWASPPPCNDSTPQTVWRQINAVVAAPGDGWPLECVQAEGINAYVDHAHHRVAYHHDVAGLSNNEIAAILSHERSHLALGHPPPGGAIRSATQEDAADRLGVFYMRLAGFDPHGAINLLSRFEQTPDDLSRRRRLEGNIAAAEAWVPMTLEPREARRLGTLIRRRMMRD